MTRVPVHCRNLRALPRFAALFAICASISLPGLVAVAAAQQPIPWPAGVITGEQARAIARQKGWLIESRTPKQTVVLHSLLNGRPMYRATTNRDSAGTISTDDVRPGGAAGLSLTGAGVVLGIWDGGDVRLTHQDFRVQRATDGDGPDGFGAHFHATHVAGTMIGVGDTSGQTLGMSPSATLRCFDFDLDLEEVSDPAQAGIKASNHSYGLVAGWFYFDNPPPPFDEGWYWLGDTRASQTEDSAFGAYSVYTALYDLVAAANPNGLMVFSAGNDRGEGPPPGTLHFVYDYDSGQYVTSTATRNLDGGPQGYDCISHESLAKNVLTVGAVMDAPAGYTQPSNVVMTSFSCWGPADDGRVKPDITANGYQLVSTGYTSDSATLTLTGTSMSAPSVTGSLGLLIQHYRSTHAGQADLRGASLKGLVIHSADECGPGDGPDYSFGWGLMNTRSAAAVITRDQTLPLTIQERTLNNGQSYELLAASDTTATQFKVTLCWFDPYFQVSSEDPPLNSRTPALVNNLELRVTDAETGVQILPWVLNPNFPANAAVRADNNIDNVEVVTTALAFNQRRNFRIRINHDGALRGGSQNYTLIVTGAAMLAESECNSNGIIDAVDLSGGTSRDCNTNAAPDECDIRSGGVFDCNTNASPDVCDLRLGITGDCNTNLTPDPCDLRSPLFRDCDTNAALDICDVRFGGAAVDCNTSNTPDACEADCNTNQVQDACESRDGGAAVDCNSNHVPDDCEQDCNTNGVADTCELDTTAGDCNTNRTPDSCEIRIGKLADCNGNFLADMCEPNQDGDSAIDACDGCPFDPNKTAPGACGCGRSDGDADGDGLIDCNDGCPFDAGKTDPGACGCGVSESDADGDGTPDCTDGCPDDASRSDPGLCGCGVTPEQCTRLLGCPRNVTITATDEQGGVLEFASPQQIGQPGRTVIEWSHPSGSVFPVGNTVVTFTARDTATGEQVSCSFVVTVKALPIPRGTGQPAPVPDGASADAAALLGDLCGLFGMGGAALQAALCGGGLVLMRSRVRARRRAS